MSLNLTTIDPSTVDITTSAFKADPFPFYGRLRADAPVARVRAGRRIGSVWVVTRYDDVASLLRDDRFVKDAAAAMTPAQLRRAPRIPGGPFKPLQSGLLSVDPPDHTRLRALVNRAFTPRMMEEWRGEVEVLSDDLVTTAMRRGTVDLVADFATPLPLIMVGRILGVPKPDAERFHRWWQVFVTAGDGRNALRVVPTLLRMLRFLRRLVRERTDAPQSDLISALAQAKQDGDRLSEDEIVAMIFLLLSAGHETTVNLLGSGTLALLQHPDQLALLRDDPTVARTGVEELLRFVAPVETSTERYARQDADIADITIPRGDPRRHRLGKPRRGPFRGPRHARPATRPEPAPRVRQGHPLLPGRPAGAHGGIDRPDDAAVPCAGAAPCGARRRAPLAVQLPRPWARVPAGDPDGGSLTCAHGDSASSTSCRWSHLRVPPSPWRAGPTSGRRSARPLPCSPCSPSWPPRSSRCAVAGVGTSKSGQVTTMEACRDVRRHGRGARLLCRQRRQARGMRTRSTGPCRSSHGRRRRLLSDAPFVGLWTAQRSRVGGFPGRDARCRRAVGTLSHHGPWRSR